MTIPQDSASYLARVLLAMVIAVLAGCGGPGEPAPEWNSAETSSAGATTGIEDRGSKAADDSSKWWAALPREAWSHFERVELRDSWFEVYRIRDNIFAIYEPGQFEEVISYLIVGESRALLFDAGLGIGNIRGVVKQLTTLPISVLNSHSHYDHVGGNHQFETVLGRSHPYSRERARGLSNEDVGRYALGDWIWKPTPPGFIPGAFATRGWEYSRWIEEGQFIDLGSVSLEVVYAPGHSPDSLVLVDHQHRLMFTGDTFYLAPLYSHIPGASFDDYAATASRLAGLRASVDTLLMAHNTPTASGEYLVKLDAAFQAIISGEAPFERYEDGREYRFDGFAILTAEPPTVENAGADLP